MAGLSATVKTLKPVVVAEAELLVACDKHAVPINEFGDPTNNSYGYHYFDGTQYILTTALDLSTPSDTGAGWFAYGDSTCSTALGGLRHVAARVGVSVPPLSPHPGLLTAHQH